MMKRSLMIYQAIIGFTALLTGFPISIPVNAKTSIPAAASDSFPAADDITKWAKNNDAPKRPRVVPSQLGVCALELIKLERGKLAVCTETNLAYSGILLDCTDLGGAKAATCEAATRTMPNLGKHKQVSPAPPTR
jgi:hypothetical protein